MSGYEQGSVSRLGGGKPGQFESGYGNTLVGGEVALNRRKLRKAFKSNIERSWWYKSIMWSLPKCL